MALLSQSMRDDFPLLYELMKPLPKERWVVVLLWLSVSTAARLILSTQVSHSLTSQVLTDSFLIAVQVLSISRLYCFHHWPWLHLHVHTGSQLSPFFFKRMWNLRDVDCYFYHLLLWPLRCKKGQAKMLLSSFLLSNLLARSEANAKHAVPNPFLQFLL